MVLSYHVLIPRRHPPQRAPLAAPAAAIGAPAASGSTRAAGLLDATATARASTPRLPSAAAGPGVAAEALTIAEHVRGESFGAHTPSKLRYPLPWTGGLGCRSCFGSPFVSSLSFFRLRLFWRLRLLLRFLTRSLLGSLRLSLLLWRLQSLLWSRLPLVARPHDCFLAECVFSLLRSLCRRSRSRSQLRSLARRFSGLGSRSRCPSSSSGRLCSNSHVLPKFWRKVA